MRRLTLPVLALFVLTACGGGAGGGDPQPQPLPDDEVILAVLQTCGLAQIDAVFEALATLQELTDPTAPPPDLAITGLEISTGRVDWALDLGDGGDPEFTGSFQVRDSGGAPLSLLGYVTIPPDIAATLAALPDGTQIETTFAGKMDANGPDLSGTITTSLVSGVPQNVSGEITADDPGCALTIGFTDISPANLAGTYPNGTFDVTIITFTETITGPAVFDGTNMATLTLSRGGGPSYVYLWNLDTNVVTLVP